MFELLDEKIKAQLKNFGIEEPTEAQKKALPKIIEGKNLLLIAPTGIGKTEAAILPIFNKIILEKEKRRLEGFFCIYITPLRALNRDLLRRIEDWGNALNITVGVRHGDTAIGERRKQTKKAPEILITTPETLQILLLGKVLRRHLKNVKAVIIDELHELAFDERGAQLSVALERLKELCGEFQRIGLSATLGNIEEARNYIGNCEVINVYASKKISVDVLYKENFNEQIELLKSLINRHSHTLIFTNSREGAETLALNLRKIDERIGIHHGSLSKDVRINMEEEFKKGNLKALVCTSSLELGIDIGIIDYVIQFSSPRQVTRLVQ
ncbi:MAG: DEAD/DEAH box helicase, partial [Candidatus Thermoplasmatota archaeon]